MRKVPCDNTSGLRRAVKANSFRKKKEKRRKRCLVDVRIKIEVGRNLAERKLRHTERNHTMRRIWLTKRKIIRHKTPQD